MTEWAEEIVKSNTLLALIFCQDLLKNRKVELLLKV